MFTMFIPVGYDTVCEMAVFHNNYEREKTYGINIRRNKKQQCKFKSTTESVKTSNLFTVEKSMS